LTRTEGFGWPYYEKLKANGVAVGQGNGSVITAVAGGEKAYGLVVDYMAMRAKAQGSPVDYVYLAEGSPIVTEPVGIVKKDGSDAADARRFVDFVLSEAGQELVSKQGYVPARRGVPVPAGLKGADQVKALDYDSAVLVREREWDKTLFGELFGN
jgi:iron(III) transport system substrate-binding protein